MSACAHAGVRRNRSCCLSCNICAAWLPWASPRRGRNCDSRHAASRSARLPPAARAPFQAQKQHHGLSARPRLVPQSRGECASRFCSLLSAPGETTSCGFLSTGYPGRDPRAGVALRWQVIPRLGGQPHRGSPGRALREDFQLWPSAVPPLAPVPLGPRGRAHSSAPLQPSQRLRGARALVTWGDVPEDLEE